jgi:hypothetical protein
MRAHPPDEFFALIRTAIHATAPRRFSAHLAPLATEMRQKEITYVGESLARYYIALDALTHLIVGILRLPEDDLPAHRAQLRAILDAMLAAETEQAQLRMFFGMMLEEEGVPDAQA